MALFSAEDRRFLEVLSQLINANPFLEDWVKLEMRALGEEFSESARPYHPRPEWGAHSRSEQVSLSSLDFVDPNTARLGARSSRLAITARQRLAAGVTPTDREHVLYQDLALYDLYERNADALDDVIVADKVAERRTLTTKAWRQFEVTATEAFPDSEGKMVPSGYPFTHVFAWFFQLRRAFHHIYRFMFGSSLAAAQLRGAVWQSIFTADMKRWSRSLYAHMQDFPTLITGPSGTGKELVARAIGLSRYIEFDQSTRSFKRDYVATFHPLNLSALAPTLIESELFGHVAGAFTGAQSERTGWLGKCKKYGAVFLDEVGELEPAIQVKLLRVLEAREFQKLGETRTHRFTGKIIAATNRDLDAEMRAGRFRPDLFYRLCADRITTPSLRELVETPEDLHGLLLFIARDIVGEQEAGQLADEASLWIEKHLPAHPWPGNFRELAQCVRSIALRREYHPAGRHDARRDLSDAILAGTLTADELQRRYFTLVYAQTKNYQKAAERLRCDYRTLKDKIDEEYLAELKS